MLFYLPREEMLDFIREIVARGDAGSYLTGARYLRYFAKYFGEIDTADDDG